MKRWLFRIWVFFGGVCLAAGLCAQTSEGGSASASPSQATPVLSPEDLPQAIAWQRQALTEQRQAIFAQEQQQRAHCWQKFAVNACLSEARRTRRLALNPIHQQELLLNAQERAWRTEQRDVRLQNKQDDSQDKP